MSNKKEIKDIYDVLANPEMVFYVMRMTLQPRLSFGTPYIHTKKGDNGLDAVGQLITISPRETPPEIAIVNAARTSFLGNTGNLEKDRKLLKYLYKHDHSGPFESSDILLKLYLDTDEYISLLEDTRYKVYTYRIDSDKDNKIQVYIRIDANNALRYYDLHKDYDRNNTLFICLKSVFESFLPWTAKELGLEPKTEINKYNPITSPRKFIDLFRDEKMGWVELQNSMATDKMVANIYANTFNSYGFTNDEIIGKIFKSGDLRILSLFTLQFRLKAPTVVWWQLVRHRSFSFSLQSGRYKPFKEDEFFLPKTWREQSESNKQGSHGEIDKGYLNGFFEQFYDNDEYHDFPAVNADSEGVSDYLDKYSKKGFELYSALLQSGGSKEQSRYFLPAWISPYEGIVKVDLLFFLRFLRLRLDNHAQLEIREYAQKMYDLWAEIMPITAKYAKENNFQGS